MNINELIDNYKELSIEELEELSSDELQSYMELELFIKVRNKKVDVSRIQSMLSLFQYDINIRNKDLDEGDNEITILHMIASSGNKELIQLFLHEEYKDPLNAQDKDGYTPLHYAINSRKPEAVNVLLELGANIEAQNNIHFETPLFTAMNNYSRILSYLWQPIRPIDHTPYIEIIKILLDAGANLNAETTWGNSPLEVGKRYGIFEKISYRI